MIQGGKTLLTTAFPAVKATIDFASSSYQLIQMGKGVYQQVMSLYEKKDEGLQFSDLIPLITSLKDTALCASQFKSAYGSSMKIPKSIPMPKKPNFSELKQQVQRNISEAKRNVISIIPKDKKSGEKIVKSTAVMLAPKSSSDALISLDGVTLSGSVSQRGLKNKGGVAAGIAVSLHAQQSGTQKKVIAADVILTGGDIQVGSVNAKDQFYVDAKKLQFKEKGHSKINNPQVHAATVIVDGSVRLHKEKSAVSKQESVDFPSVTKEAMKSPDDFQVSEKLIVGSSGRIEAEGVSFSVKDFAIESENGSASSERFTLQKGSLSATTASIAGETKIEQSSVIVATSLHLTGEGHLTASQSLLETQSLQVDSSGILHGDQQSQIHVVEEAKIAGVAELEDSTLRSKTLTVSSDTAHESAHLKSVRSKINVESELIVGPLGHVSASDHSGVKAGHLDVRGQLETKQSTMAAKTLTITENGEVHAHDKSGIHVEEKCQVNGVAQFSNSLLYFKSPETNSSAAESQADLKEICSDEKMKAVLEIGASGRITASEHSNIQVDHVEVAGRLETTQSVMKAQSLTLTASGTLHGKQQSEVEIKEHTQIHGSAIVEDSVLRSQKISLEEPDSEQKLLSKKPNLILNRSVAFAKEMEVKSGSLVSGTDGVVVTDKFTHSGEILSEKLEVRSKSFIATETSKTHGETIVIQADDIKNSGEISARKQLKISSKTLWNSGQLKAGKQARYAVEYYFVNTGTVHSDEEMTINAGIYANLSTLSRSGLSIAETTAAQQLTINAGINLNIGGLFETHTLSTNALVNLNLGVTRSFHGVSHSLLGFDGIELPAMATWNDLFTKRVGVGLAKSAVKFFFPAKAAKVLVYTVSGIDTVSQKWNTLSSLKSNTYRVGKDIYKKGFSAYHLAEILTIAQQARELYNNGIELPKFDDGQQSERPWYDDCVKAATSSLTPTSSHHSLLSVSGVSAVPVTSYDSMYYYNAGVMANHTLNVNTKHYVNNGRVAARNFNVQASGRFQNNGTIVNDSGSVSAREISVQGDWRFSDRLKLAATDTITFSEQSHLEGDRSSSLLQVEAKRCETRGFINSKTVAIGTKEQLKNSGSISVVDGSMSGGDVVITSEINYSGKLNLIAQEGDIKLATSSRIIKESSPNGQATAEPSLFITAKGRIESAGLVQIDSGRLEASHIDHQGKAEWSGQLDLVAKEKVLFSESSHLAGDPDHSVLRVEAKDGDFHGIVETSKMELSVSHLEDTSDLLSSSGRYSRFPNKSLILATDSPINVERPVKREGELSVQAPTLEINQTVEGESVRLMATKGDIAIHRDIQSQGKLILEAKKDVAVDSGAHVVAKQAAKIQTGGTLSNTDSQISADQLQVRAAHVKNSTTREASLAEISGQKVLIEAFEGDVENSGGSIRGSQVLQVRAQKRVINQCVEYTTPSEQGVKKHYQPAEMVGGEGERTVIHQQIAGKELEINESVGLVIQAGGKIINDASVIRSKGSNLLIAQEGYEAKARSHQYQTKQQESGWLGFRKQQNRQIQAKVQESLLVSSQGNNWIISDEGGIEATASHFVAQEGSVLVAKKDISLKGLVHTQEQITDTSYCWGLFNSHHHTKQQVDTPSLIYDEGQSELITQQNIDAHQVMILGAGALKIRAKNAKFAAEKLTHHVSSRGHQLNLNASWLSAITAVKDGQNPLSAGAECDPLLSKAGSFIRSRDVLAGVTNGWNLGLEGYNTAMSIAEAHQEQTWSQFVLGRYPLGDLQYSYHSGKGAYTTLDSSAIHRGSLDIEVEETLTFDGLPVRSDGPAQIKARQFIQSGVALPEYSREKVFGFNIGLSPFTGVAGIEISYAEKGSKGIRQQSQSFTVAGELAVDIDHWRMEGAQTTGGQLTGHVGRLDIISQQDSWRDYHFGGSLDSLGQVSLHKGRGQSHRAVAISGIEAQTFHQLHIGKLSLNGGRVVAQRATEFAVDTTESHQLENHTDQKNYGISLNVKTLMWDVNRSSKTIATTRVINRHSFFNSRQRPVLFIAEGVVEQKQSIGDVLQTCSADGMEVVAQKSIDIAVDIPLPKFQKKLEQPSMIDSEPLKKPSGAEDAIEQKRTTDDVAVTQESLDSNLDIALPGSQLKSSQSRAIDSKADFIVPKGQLTFEVEGREGGRFHSRKPKVPGKSSGVTIGRGYDLGCHTRDEIVADLTAAGLTVEAAEAYACGAGLVGDCAQKFIDAHKGLVEITTSQQKKLFEIVYPRYETDAKRLCEKKDVVEIYGRTNWTELHPAIKDIVTDLHYRGDYSGKEREFIQKYIVANNLDGFTKMLADKSYWPGVPKERFEERVKHLEKFKKLPNVSRFSFLASATPALNSSTPAPVTTDQIQLGS